MTPIQKAVTECLQWMRENHEEEDLPEFDKAALLVSGSVAALEAQVGPNAPEMKRLRTSETNLRAALLHVQHRGHPCSAGCDGCRNVTLQTRLAYDGALAADVASDTASAGLVLT